MKKTAFSLICICGLIFCLSSAVQSQNLATIQAEARSTELDGRTLATARNHHFIIDAPPPLGGPTKN